VLPVDALHEARRGMMTSALTRRFGANLSQRTALDLACHQGYFSCALSELVKSVTCLDVSARSLADAQRMAAVLGHSNLSFVRGDVQEVDESTIQPADIVLMYGLIYHIEDPLRLLRRASRWCHDMLLIETQLAPFEYAGRIEWGSYNHFHDVRGLYALVDDQDNPEGGVTSMALVPSFGALHAFLTKIGFTHAVLLESPDDSAEQLARGQRGVIAAYR
jgi:tRNA (mo5U34)-methyltransferase